MPSGCLVGVRIGDTLKQGRYEPQRCYHFPQVDRRRNAKIDIYQHIGTCTVTADPDVRSNHDVAVTSKDPSCQGVRLRVSVQSQADDSSKKQREARVKALKSQAGDYLTKHNLEERLSEVVKALLKEQPADPTEFLCNALRSGDATPPAPVAPVAPPPEQRSAPEPADVERAAGGLGDRLPADGSACLPDLSGHHSVLATVLRSDPSVCSRLQSVRSAAGVTLAQCMRPGIDHKGHPLVRTVGLAAGDESCFRVFGDVFEPVIHQLHASFARGSRHAADLDSAGVSDLPLDASGSRVVSVQVQGSRSLSGGLRMPPAASLEELCEAERLLSRALVVGGGLQGAYHPLRGSGSWVPQPGGTSESDEQELRASGFLFEEPDSAIMLSAGYGHCWPHGRGVFVGRERDFFVWVNEADHLKIISRQSGGGLKQAFERFVSVERLVGASLKASGSGYACDSRFGFLNSCPSNIGTALHVSATLRIPLLSAHGKQLKARCMGLRLQARQLGQLWELSNHTRLGCSEAAQVNTLIDGCRELTALEARLEAGEDPSVVLGEGPPPKAEAAPPQAVDRIADLREQLADVLIKASVDGELNKVLRDIKMDADPPSAPPPARRTAAPSPAQLPVAFSGTPLQRPAMLLSSVSQCGPSFHSMGMRPAMLFI